MFQFNNGVDIGTCIVLITWACVNVRTYINPRFIHILSSRDRLSTLITSAGFTFCFGLLEILRADDPPSLLWIKSLSTEIPKNVWAIYVLVLEKRGHRPLLYIGSASSSKRGARARLREHKSGQLSPVHVKKARRRGYKITHMALLAHCPIPAPADMPAIRTVIVAIEAAFSCILWAMCSRQLSYGLSGQTLWARDSFEWDGLCGHNPLVEAIRADDMDFTAEELEEIAAAVKEKDRLYQYQYQRALRANPTEEYRSRQKRNNEKQKSATKVRQKSAVENQQYHCAACGVSCRDNASLIRHNATKRHQKKVRQGDEDFHCAACNLSFRYQSNFNKHKQSKGHISKMAASNPSST